jgi:hypothetical protein
MMDTGKHLASMTCLFSVLKNDFKSSSGSYYLYLNNKIFFFFFNGLYFYSSNHYSLVAASSEPHFFIQSQYAVDVNPCMHINNTCNARTSHRAWQQYYGLSLCAWHMSHVESAFCSLYESWIKVRVSPEKALNFQHLTWSITLLYPLHR